ncbi:uncharacterized protein V1518DRAFT_411384 [Limtongia smithiae]|uniref:uncharacterized protein n=1 Tax=Limtongia smithiae TaxID=1125753 RepID=UPI0034CF60F9
MSGSLRRPPPTSRITHLKLTRPYETSKASNECAVLMSELFNCWAGTKLNAVECSDLEVRMQRCYDSGKRTIVSKSSFNHHAGRLYPKLSRKRQD